MLLDIPQWVNAMSKVKKDKIQNTKYRDRADSEEGKATRENIQGSEWTELHLLGLYSGGKQYTEQLLKMQDTSCGPKWG